jgi:hypothetical protein
MVATGPRAGTGSGVQAGSSTLQTRAVSVALGAVSYGSGGAYGGEGGRMIAAISIGIIIVIAVIVAALAIVYFILKGSPR